MMMDNIPRVSELSELINEASRGPEQLQVLLMICLVLIVLFVVKKSKLSNRQSFFIIICSIFVLISMLFFMPIDNKSQCPTEKINAAIVKLTRYSNQKEIEFGVKGGQGYRIIGFFQGDSYRAWDYWSTTNLLNSALNNHCKFEGNNRSIELKVRDISTNEIIRTKLERMDFIKFLINIINES